MHKNISGVLFFSFVIVNFVLLVLMCSVLFSNLILKQRKTSVLIAHKSMNVSICLFFPHHPESVSALSYVLLRFSSY